MKLEFLGEGSSDCPLIRLYDYVPGELEGLIVACRELAAGKRTEFQMHDLPWVKSIGGCRFIWRRGPRDVGVRLPASGEPFILDFSDEAWREVKDELQQFLGDSGGYQWLTNEGDVQV